jgi:hypothetical protein
MSEQLHQHDLDDVEGHSRRFGVDAERDEADDVEGHGYRPAGIDAFAEDEDDVAGHMAPRPSGVHDAVTDDVEGRHFPAGSSGSQRDAGDDDDVAGHGLGPADPKR